MGRIQESLEANKEEILKNLPKELHEHFEKEVEAAEDPAQLSDEEELAAIKAELVKNPDIAEADAIAGLEQNPTAHKPLPPPTEEEQKKEMEAALKTVQSENQ